MAKDNIRFKIMQAIKEEININGSDFTLDMVAKRAGVSKKTIYNNFEDKKEVVTCVIEDVFMRLEERRVKIVNDTDMDIVEIIKKLLVLIPVELSEIDLHKYESVCEKYPELLEYVNDRIEVEWTYITEYLELAMKQGRIKRRNFSAVKTVWLGTIRYYLVYREQCMSNDVTICEILSIIMNGLKMK
ncbi:MAG: TetR/AcrR family transcriptional regulator [Lachnospiraceae bacterium]|nr:TetR/AcrR family transcriptional regulator [Lachnospiraceae bacterium]